MQRYPRRIFFSLLVGLISGSSASLFLHSLNLVTELRLDYPGLIWGLPLAGFLIGWTYWKFAGRAQQGTNLILEQIHEPNNTLPLRMAPLVFAGTLLTHLFGGSAGREGTAVQMGASLVDQLSKYFNISPGERKVLLITGVGASFGAAIGAPWAGVLFGMELVRTKKRSLRLVAESLIASFTAFGVTHLLRTPHSVFPQITAPAINLENIFWILVAGVFFGTAARLFFYLVHLTEKGLAQAIKFMPLRPFIMGLILVGLYHWEGSWRFAGLGIPVIQDSLQQISSFTDPLFKSIFTALTIGSGFKGGEFIPLVFIGTSLGSALAVFIPLSFNLLGAVGFAAVFAGAANTPLTCTLMAMELFGPSIGPFALLACGLSHYVAGPHGTYSWPRPTPAE